MRIFHNQDNGSDSIEYPLKGEARPYIQFIEDDRVSLIIGDPRTGGFFDVILSPEDYKRLLNRDDDEISGVVPVNADIITFPYYLR